MIVILDRSDLAFQHGSTCASCRRTVPATFFDASARRG
jgi:hypothetical protein